VTCWRDLLRQGQDYLGSDDATREISIFIRHQTGSAYVDWNEDVTDAQIDGFQDFLRERQNGRPLSKILGRREFWKDEFVVTDHVLDPRPDSELLVEQACKLPDVQRILELGVGSGAVLLSVLREMPKDNGVGVDNSPQAIEITHKNAERLGLLSRVQLIESDWFSNVEGTFDLIICNPPYLSAAEYEARPIELNWDPQSALSDNDDGLSVYRLIARTVGNFLMPRGVLLLEIGWTQAQAVTTIFSEQGFDNFQVFKDINGKDRVLKIFQICSEIHSE